MIDMESLDRLTGVVGGLLRDTAITPSSAINDKRQRKPDPFRFVEAILRGTAQPVSGQVAQSNGVATGITR